MSRRDLPDVVMRFDSLRRSHETFDPLPPTKTPRGLADTASPYRSVLRDLQASRDAGAATPRTPGSANKARRLTRSSTSSRYPSSSCPGNACLCVDLQKICPHSGKRYSLRRPGGQALESKARPPPFQSSVVGMVSDLRDQTIKGEHRTPSKGALPFEITMSARLQA